MRGPDLRQLAKNRIFEESETGETWEVTIIRACPPPRPREKYLLGVSQDIGNTESLHVLNVNFRSLRQSLNHTPIPHLPNTAV